MLGMLEAVYWTSVYQKAKQGDEEAIQTLEAENGVRKKNGDKTIEEELMEIIKAAKAKG